MKLAFFSDIHGNQYVLDLLFAELKKCNVDAMFFLGDIFGYYYGQNNIIQTFAGQKNLHCIKGNHDQNFLDIIDGKQHECCLVDKYGYSYMNIKERISASNQTFVANLSEKIVMSLGGKRIGVFHGSPSDPLNGRIYPDTDLNTQIFPSSFDYIVVGHTHYRMHRKYKDMQILNPGSIGQARDGKGFGFLTLDTTTDAIEFHDIVCDMDNLVCEIEKNDPNNQQLIEVLSRRRISN